MPRVKCPRCKAIVEVTPGIVPSCPMCGFTARAAAPRPPEPVAMATPSPSGGLPPGVPRGVQAAIMLALGLVLVLIGAQMVTPTSAPHPDPEMREEGYVIKCDGLGWSLDPDACEPHVRSGWLILGGAALGIIGLARFSNPTRWERLRGDTLWSIGSGPSDEAYKADLAERAVKGLAWRRLGLWAAPALVVLAFLLMVAGRGEEPTLTLGVILVGVGIWWSWQAWSAKARRLV